MAGIYVHIPFCRQACHYCDFHFSTNLSYQDEMVEGIVRELHLRQDYLGEGVQTIYFGGGTPSILTERQLQKVILAIQKTFSVSAEAEITLEANPEDLTESKLASLKDVGINRLSIGIQTFSDTKLKWMNRAHTAAQAAQAVLLSRKVGFDNISLDLIYAIPGRTTDGWFSDLKQITDLNPDHISLYGLTVEHATVFGNWKEKGKFNEVPEEKAAEQYLSSIAMLKEKDYDQYEVSNFAKDGLQSGHNSAYWSGSPYLGVGPGAHSFNGSTRQFNVRNNMRYLSSLHNGSDFYEMEKLTLTQQMNEHILTQLRTVKGVDTVSFERKFGHNLFQEFSSTLKMLKHKGWITVNDQKFSLTPTGFLLADEIALKFFFNE